MNELIKKLAEQAFFDESTSRPSTKMYTFSEHKMKKFAELIVQECAGIAYEYDLPNHTGILPGEFIGNRMKRLFGVEE
jgi:hypothetical protein